MWITITVLAICLFALCQLLAVGLGGANPGSNNSTFVDGCMIFFIILLLLPYLAVRITLYLGCKVPGLSKICQPAYNRVVSIGDSINEEDL